MTKLTRFEKQIIIDLWQDYLYSAREIDNPNEINPDSNTIGYFREWLVNDHDIIAFNKYLTESDSALADIIKQCLSDPVTTK